MSEIKDIVVPDLGGISDVEVIEIVVKPGDVVAKEDTLIVLESDKASMDVPSPFDGVIESIEVSNGQMISEGSLVAKIKLSDSADAPAATPEKQAAVEQAAPAPATTPVAEQAPAPKATPGVATEKPVMGAAIAKPPPAERSGTALAHASPGVRRFARELGADVSQIRGTGNKGRITQQDVKDFIKIALSSGAGAASSSGASEGMGLNLAAVPQIDFSQFGETSNLALSRIKKISGPFLSRSWVTIPHVTHHDEADITELEAFRKSIKDEALKQDVRITMLAFIAKAVVKALQDFPSFNSSLNATGDELILKQYYNLGIAVDTPNGLMVPNIKDAHKKGIYDLARDMADLSVKARDGKIKPQDLQGGTFSISSLGGIGGIGFTPIINMPEVAILGVSRSRYMPVYNGKEFVPRFMLPLDLSYDHRVIDGAQAARFMVHLCKILSDPRRMLL